MRVSIVNCVSTAARMMRFSDESLLRNAGHGDFDYVVVKWLASPEVEEYLSELPRLAMERHPACRVIVTEHVTDPTVGYVPNLRAMMNRGFCGGFSINDYAGLVNTDCYFGPGWLRALVDRAKPKRVINSFHVTAAVPPRPVAAIMTENLGRPEPETFDCRRFAQICAEYKRENTIIAPADDYRQAASMPYLFHRDLWERCGPWELTTENGAPDVRFFNRAAATGAEFAFTHASVVYHHEAVERRGRRPAGAERMSEE